jgi:hypothetical protein
MAPAITGEIKPAYARPIELRTPKFVIVFREWCQRSV